MKEIMYSQSSVLIVSGLFVLMLLGIEIGVRAGRRRQASATEAITQANAVLAAMLGLLALLLAFTFSAALQRYEDRSQTVVAEANAIGTTYLRVRLLPAGMQEEVQALLRQYLDVRMPASTARPRASSASASTGSPYSCCTSYPPSTTAYAGERNGSFRCWTTTRSTC